MLRFNQIAAFDLRAATQHEIRLVLSDDTLSSSRKRKLIHSIHLLSLSMQLFARNLFTYTGKYPYHNIDHSLSVAELGATLVEGCYWDCLSPSFCYYIGAAHDSVMVMKEGVFSQRVARVDADGSEGRSALLALITAEEQNGFLFSSTLRDPLKALFGEGSILSINEMERIAACIGGTVPSFTSCIPTSKHDLLKSQRLGTINNSGDLVVEVDDSGNDLALINRDPTTHQYKAGYTLDMRVNELCDELFSDIEDVFSAYDQLLQYVYPVLWSDLADSIHKKDWSTRLSANLFAELFPHQATTLLKSTTLHSEAVKEAVTNFIGFIQSQIQFGMGKATGLEERNWAPLLAMQKRVNYELEDMDASERESPIGRRIIQMKIQLDQLIDNFKRQFCSPVKRAHARVNTYGQTRAQQYYKALKKMDVSKVAMEFKVHVTIRNGGALDLPHDAHWEWAKKQFGSSELLLRMNLPSF